MNKSNSAAQIALLACGLCVLLITAVAVHRSKSRQLDNLKTNLADKQRQLEDANRKIKEKPQLEAQYAELSNKVAILEPALPTEAYMPTFLSQIERLAGQTGNQLTLIKPEAKKKLKASAAVPEADVTSSNKQEKSAVQAKPAPAAEKSPYDEIGIQVDFDGTYWTALSFMEKLRAFPKMIAVNEVSLEPKSRNRKPGEFAPPNPLLEVSLRLTAVMAKGK